MIWAVRLFFAAGTLLVFQSLWAFIDGLRFLRLIRDKHGCPAPDYAPSAAVVIACKGLSQGFQANVEGFLRQEYPHYRVIFVVASQSDPAYQCLRTRMTAHESAGGSPCAMSLVVAGFADGRGEKVNNLLRGLEAVPPNTEVLAFADIDATPSTTWLRWLVAPLADSPITVSTGFRWYLPGRSFASRLRAAWDTSIATTMRDRDQPFPWGGSMAIRAADFRARRVAEHYWTSTVSDDYALARAVKDAGGMIAFQPQCLIPSREESSFSDFLRWSTRQIVITRVYASRLWKLGLASYLLYCGTFAWGVFALIPKPVIAFQRPAVAGLLLPVLLLGMGKGFIRSMVTRELFAADADRGVGCYWQLAPLVPWIMLANFVAAAFQRRIEWCGTEYQLVSPEKVEVLRRSSRC